jgi:hypothetical protein
MNLKMKTTEGEGVEAHPSLIALRGRKACWSSEMGTRKIDKQVNFSHRLAQFKQ